MWGGYEILQGAVDMHIHSNPDMVKRPQDEYEIALQAREVGYKGILLKQATFFNGSSALSLRRLFPEIHIAILTDYDFPEYRQAALQFGADRFFVKNSFNYDEVEALVESISPGALAA